MVTVIRRPIGHKLSPTQYTGRITTYAGNAVLVADENHELSTGEYVYIETNIDSYNGFRYVDVVSYTEFLLKESADGDYVSYKQEADAVYYVATLNHGWQCVHLPIVYELESNLWPNNLFEEGYTPRTVLSFDVSDGFTRLVLSTDLLETPYPFGYIQIVGTGPLAGVYRILEVLNGAEVIVNLPYDAGNSFVGYEVVTYHNNYVVTVNVYGGLHSGHPWEDEKPIELLASLQFKPNSDNRIVFSISDILRSQITVANNLTLDTLPNNLDFFTEFYIGYFDSYDQSDGENISTLNGAEIIDDFIGQAVNAMNEFKNQYSGHLSDYVNGDGSPARWLTEFDRPIAVVGYFFDLSFLLTIDDDFEMDISKAGVGTTTTEIDNPGIGVIRLPIEILGDSSEYCVQLFYWASADDLLLSSFANFGSGTSWIPGTNPSFTTGGGAFTSKYFRVPYTGGSQNSLQVEIDLSTANGFDLEVGYMNSGGTVVGSTSFAVPAIIGVQSFIEPVTATGAYSYLFIRATGFTSNSFELTEYSVQARTALTEEICIDVIDECGTTFNGELRITEEEILRQLE